MYKRMLIPLDGSRLSGAVLPHAISLVEDKYIMKRAKKKLANLRVSFLIRDGLIAETIPGVADAIYADFIAISFHGRSEILRWLLYSMTDRAVRHCALPVMLIRPQKADFS